MLDQIQKINQEAANDQKKVTNVQELDDFRLKFLSRKGIISSLFSEMKNIDAKDRGTVGQKINQLKKDIEASFKKLEEQLKTEKVSQEKIDLFLPGTKPFVGRLHPLTQVLQEIKEIFFNLGFRVEDGPEIETDFYNFEALNIPKDHPARDMQDTLYITEEVLLRTHTSPVQIRVMQSQKPPISIIAPGRVYRRDTPDASHSGPRYFNPTCIFTYPTSFSTAENAIKIVFGTWFCKREETWSEAYFDIRSKHFVSKCRNHSFKITETYTFINN